VRFFAADASLAVVLAFSKMRSRTNLISKNAFYPADSARMALEEMESYCAAHPSSPSAVRRPALSIRNGLWIALLGPGIEEGIVGIGFTVKTALRDFDIQYMTGLRSAE
jgi:hypothetical protein